LLLVREVRTRHGGEIRGGQCNLSHLRLGFRGGGPGGGRRRGGGRVCFQGKERIYGRRGPGRRFGVLGERGGLGSVETRRVRFRFTRYYPDCQCQCGCLSVLTEYPYAPWIAVPGGGPRQRSEAKGTPW
jgi:hypothetical protein